jgi:ABC-type uncharacterized transport system ATPase component
VRGFVHRIRAAGNRNATTSDGQRLVVRDRAIERISVGHAIDAVTHEAQRRRARAAVALVIERPLRVAHQQRKRGRAPERQREAARPGLERVGALGERLEEPRLRVRERVERLAPGRREPRVGRRADRAAKLLLERAEPLAGAPERAQRVE